MTIRFAAWVVAPLLFILGISSARTGEKGAAILPKHVFVVNTGDGTVSLVDLGAMKEVEKHKVGPRPYGIAVSQDGKTVAVGIEDEEKVRFFSLPGFKFKGETKIGKMFNDHIVLTRDGKHILVANFYSDDVVGIEVETMKEAFRSKIAAPRTSFATGRKTNSFT